MHSRRMTKSEYKKYSAQNAAYQTYHVKLSQFGEHVDDAVDNMTTRQLYTFLKRHGWEWSIALEKWTNNKLYMPTGAQS